MIKKIKERIISINYKKAAKIFIIVSFVLILTSGIISAVSLRTQIGEAISYCQEADRHDEKEHEEHIDREQDEINEARDEHNDEDKKFDKEHEWEFEFLKEQNFTKPSLFSKISVIVLGMICLSAAAVYWLLIAAWLYKAAYEASMNAVFWGILGLIGNLAAVILFMIARRSYQVCPSCGKRQKHGVYCSDCGSPFGISCSWCGENVKKEDTYCKNCGKYLKEQKDDD